MKLAEDIPNKSLTSNEVADVVKYDKPDTNFNILFHIIEFLLIVNSRKMYGTLLEIVRYVVGKKTPGSKTNIKLSKSLTYVVLASFSDQNCLDYIKYFPESPAKDDLGIENLAEIVLQCMIWVFFLQ